MARRRICRRRCRCARRRSMGFHPRLWTCRRACEAVPRSQTCHAAYVPAHHIHPATCTLSVLPEDHRMNSISLFAGCGGMDLGVERAGFKHLLAVEMDKSAVMTHRAYFNGKVFEGRCEDALARLVARFPTWAESGAGEVDLLHGGVPCTPFSQAGAGRGEYDPRDGFPHFIAWLRYVQPRAFLIENVKGLTTKKHRPYLDRVLADLRACGYTVDWRVHNAADYGVPQRRERILIVGFREAAAATAYKWPEPTHSEESLVRDKWITGDYWRGSEMIAGSFPVAPL